MRRRSVMSRGRSESSAIEREDQGLLKLPQHVEHRGSRGGIGLDSRFANDDGDASPLQLVDKSGARRVARHHMPATRRGVENSAVLTDDHVEARQIARYAA